MACWKQQQERGAAQHGAGCHLPKAAGSAIQSLHHRPLGDGQQRHTCLPTCPLLQNASKPLPPLLPKLDLCLFQQPAGD